MLCLKLCRGTRLCTISDVLLPPSAALSRLATPGPFRLKSVEHFGSICSLVITKRCLSCAPHRRSNQCQDQSAHITTWKGPQHQFHSARSAFSPPRLLPLRILRSHYPSAPSPTCSATQVSIRRCLTHQHLHVRSQATVHNPIAILLQPLDPPCHGRSVRRGSAICLPILLIYLLLYAVNFVPQESNLGQQYKNIVGRFWSYQRYEGFQNFASLGTYVTSQFTHSCLTRLVLDSLVLVGVGSILSSVFNRRTFFAVYVLGGFLAAAADCAWARFTNPSRGLTQAQIDQVFASAHLYNEALVELANLRASSQIFTMRGIIELFSNPGDFSKKYSRDIEEVKRQSKVIHTYHPRIRPWIRWTRRNWAASGSLVCLCMPTTHWDVCSVSPSCDQACLDY